MVMMIMIVYKYNQLRLFLSYITVHDFVELMFFRYLDSSQNRYGHNFIMVNFNENPLVSTSQMNFNLKICELFFEVEKHIRDKFEKLLYVSQPDSFPPSH